MHHSSRLAGLLLSPLILLFAQRAAGQSKVPADSVVVKAIGARYAGSWLRRALLGSEYRELWAVPISVPVLDLATFGGGLRPISRGGGQQTTSLRLRAANGREYYFRSIDKDPSPNLPPELRGTVAADVVQDQISSLHPTAPLVVAPLLEAAGVRHGEPELFILPDDERLGEFRGQFAGLVGMLEPRIRAGEAGAPLWGGAAELIDGDELLQRVGRSPDDRVDVRALLRARLVDILVGDWDRHRGQWAWARFGEATPRLWVPVPLDRDFAMVWYDGLLLAIARTSLPQLVDFGPTYPDVLGLTWNGRELDRYFLLELERSVWDSIATEVQTAITDSVIESAVRRLPAEHFGLNGASTTEALKRRRDALPDIAERFYRMLAEQAELNGSDADEIAVLQAVDERTVDVSISQSSDGAPYLRRRFHRDETKEIRLFLRGGNDTVIVSGRRGPEIRVRVIGGPGSDALIDSASAWARMYDEDAGTLVVGAAHLDRRRHTPPPKRTPTEIPPRDWGHRWQPTGQLAGGPDLGVFVGFGQTLTTYGFRKLPFASWHRFRAGIATGPWTYRVDYRGEFRRENSHVSGRLMARASGIDILRFHGFGNEQPATGPSEFYRVTQNQYAIDPSLVVPLARYVELAVGPTVRYVSTDERADRFITTLAPYGIGNFGQVGARFALTVDSRNWASTSPALFLTGAGSAYPAWWDVRSAYGELHGEAAIQLRAKAPLDPAFILRVGGKKIWGEYPYFDAAFVGGHATVRLGRENRYAGDASAYGSAELRLALARIFLGAPGNFGILGLVDAGRVYLDGEESRKWHGAVGGGLWASVLDRANGISLAMTKSEERTALYFQIGLGI